MALSHKYWSRVFAREFSKELSTLLEVLRARVLPTFDGIEGEAKKVTEEAWNQFMSMPATGNEDPSEFAEAANDIGVEHYMLLAGMRQAIVNMFAVTMYHLFEQQLMLFHRRQLLAPSEENTSELFKIKEIRKRLASHNIDVTLFPSWTVIEELRLLANTVKHAEGDSAEELRKVRPDLFKMPGLPELGEWWVHTSRSVYRPLSGHDVYVSIQNMIEFKDAIVQFWKKLAASMDMERFA